MAGESPLRIEENIRKGAFQRWWPLAGVNAGYVSDCVYR